MANDGKIGEAPCGHLGRAIIGQYYACAVCDVSDGVPEPILIEDDRVTGPLCSTCGGDDLDIYPNFALSNKTIYFCNDCKQSEAV